MSILPGFIYLGLVGGAILSRNNIVKNKIIKLGPKDASKKISENYFDYIVDVRSKKEFDLGHIKGSLFYESLASNPELIEDVLNDIKNKDSKILIYCRSGRRAYEAASIFVKNNYTKVWIVDNGGYQELRKNE